MNYDLEHIKTLIGTLSTLDDTAVIPDVYIQMDATTARKLASALRNNRVTAENQELFFTSVSIDKSGLEIFIKGQTSMVQEGFIYAMTTSGRNPIRFKGSMKTIVRGSDGFDYACNIEIGNIDFNVENITPEISDDIATFENVRARIYPYGRYQATVIEDDGD